MNKVFANKQTLTVVAHICTWGILFSMPYLLSIGNEHVFQRIVAFTWIPLLYYAVIFYSNYFSFIDRLFFKKKTGQFLLINIAILVVFIWLKNEVILHFFNELHPKTRGKSPQQLFIYADLLRFATPVLLALGVKTTQRWIASETERKEADNVKLQSELQHLRYQLQPHFFFNALNNIYFLVDAAPETAKKTIHSLGKLMRYLLHDTNTESISLQKETDFMIQYIELMKLRSPEKTEVTYFFQENISHIIIAPLLFISLLENAFKHGISATETNVLDFSLKLNDNQLEFYTSNTNFAKTEQDKSGSGIGLVNLKKRLDLLYKENYSLQIQEEKELFTVRLTILLKNGNQ